MEFSYGILQRMDQRPSPGLVTFAQLLGLPVTELKQAIDAELEQNPALELNEQDSCWLCGQPLRRGVCYNCLRRETAEAALPDDGDGPRADEDDFDLMSAIANRRTLAEVVFESLAAMVAAADLPIAEYLVGSLDERGFLPTTIVTEAVRTLHVRPEHARAVLAALQQAGPAGVGARSAQECLLLQVDRLEGYERVPPLVRPILSEYFEDLGRGKHGRIARRLGAQLEDVLLARDFIRARLRPFPIGDGATAESWSSPSDVAYVSPDILIVPRTGAPGRFTVEVPESRYYILRVSRLYRRLAVQLQAGENQTSLPEGEREHVLAHVAKAQQFISHLAERRNTLERVARMTVEYQQDYLRHGVRALKPLTRAQVAVALDLHESTVSRAVAGKYVLMPWHEILAFGDFFQAARPVEDVLNELLSQERTPCTDGELAEMLAARGYRVARRTVAKYRRRLGHLPSTLR